MRNRALVLRNRMALSRLRVLGVVVRFRHVLIAVLVSRSVAALAADECGRAVHDVGDVVQLLEFAVPVL